MRKGVKEKRRGTENERERGGTELNQTEPNQTAS